MAQKLSESASASSFNTHRTTRCYVWRPWFVIRICTFDSILFFLRKTALCCIYLYKCIYNVLSLPNKHRKWLNLNIFKLTWSNPGRIMKPWDKLNHAGITKLININLLTNNVCFSKEIICRWKKLAKSCTPTKRGTNTRIYLWRGRWMPW